MGLTAITHTVVLATCFGVLGYVVVDFSAAARGSRSSKFDNKPYMAGDRIEDSAELQLSNAPKAAIVVTHSTCAFCTESMSFYKRLASAANTSDVPLVFAAYEPPNANREYLQSQGVDVPIVVAAAQANIVVPGTPAVIVTERNTVRFAALGKLSRGMEDHVLAMLGDR